MPKTRQQKEQMLTDIKDKLQSAKSVVFSSDKGMDVKTIEKLRNEMKDNGAEYLVAKKTLLKKATADLGEGNPAVDAEGSVAMIFSYDDEVTGAQVINKYAKDSGEKLELNGGILEGKFIMADMVKKLASLPGKQQLLAQLVGQLNAPITGMVGVLSGTTRNFVGVLNAIKDKKS